jgi:hypothetical protein
VPPIVPPVIVPPVVPPPVIVPPSCECPVTTAPEPATIASALVGLAAVAGYRRFRGKGNAEVNEPDAK